MIKAVIYSKEPNKYIQIFIGDKFLCEHKFDTLETFDLTHSKTIHYTYKGETNAFFRVDEIEIVN